MEASFFIINVFEKGDFLTLLQKWLHAQAGCCGNYLKKMEVFKGLFYFLFFKKQGIFYDDLQIIVGTLYLDGIFVFLELNLIFLSNAIGKPCRLMNKENLLLT